MNEKIITLIKDIQQWTEGDLESLQTHGETGLDEETLEARLESLAELKAEIKKLKKLK